MADAISIACTEDVCDLVNDSASIISAARLLQRCPSEPPGGARVAKQVDAGLGELCWSIAQDDLASIFKIQSLRSYSRRDDCLGVRCGFDYFHACPPTVMNRTAHHARPAIPCLQIIDKTSKRNALIR